jgi:hypothetical protein
MLAVVTVAVGNAVAVTGKGSVHEFAMEYAEHPPKTRDPVRVPRHYHP